MDATTEKLHTATNDESKLGILTKMATLSLMRTAMLKPQEPPQILWTDVERSENANGIITIYLNEKSQRVTAHYGYLDVHNIDILDALRETMQKLGQSLSYVLGERPGSVV